MATLLQVIKVPRKRKQRKGRVLLKKCPQKRGMILKILERSPKKPNSAKRKVAHIYLSSTKQKLYAYIPGVKHRLREHAIVLIRGGRTQDLPGLQYKLISGPRDFEPNMNRRVRRSLYGVPLFRLERLDKTKYTKRYRLRKKIN